MYPTQLQQTQQHQILRALRAVGAVSPARACERAALGAVDAAALEALVARGTVREGAPGTFYLFDAGAGTWRRYGPRLLFWLIVVLIPYLWVTYGTFR